MMNFINIAISVYGLFQILYSYASKSSIQKYITLTKISIIELAPIVYMTFVYFVIIIMVLSIYSNLTMGPKSDIHFTIIKTMATIISVVMVILFVNATLYFLVHNFPINYPNSPFAGNYLKDAIKSNYKLPKAFIVCLWFSAATFFTVGYGDMHPVGNIMYLLLTMEMISAYVFGMIIVPVLLLKISNN